MELSWIDSNDDAARINGLPYGTQQFIIFNFITNIIQIKI